MMPSRSTRLAALSLVLFAGLAGCAAAQKAAEQDPMRCERDPKCEKKRGRTADCSLQCSDDPACVERCEQGQATVKLGR